MAMMWPLVLLVVVISVYLLLRRRGNLRLPPGPKGVPLLGNALQVPLKLMFLKFDKWAKEFGDVYSLDLAGLQMIVLNTAEAAADVLDRKSAVTSGRPELVMAGEIMTRGLLFSLMPYGERWRRCRRVTHEGFNIRAAEAYYAAQEDESVRLVQSLLKATPDAQEELTRAAGATAWRALYDDAPLTRCEEEGVTRIDHIAQVLTIAASPTGYLVNTFTFLKHLPAWAAPWKRFGNEFFHKVDSYFLQLLHTYRQPREPGKGNIALTASSVGSCERFEVNDQEAAWLIGQLFSAGVETTATAMHSFVLAMLQNPHVARKAQEEIDKVVGKRIPSFADRDQLPYVRALVQETLRWRPPAALGVPHTATEAFTFRDYYIPKGAYIIGNVWTINRDPVFFPDYEAFRPERYIDKDGKVKVPGPDYPEYSHAFGWGRRICPGRDFAVNTMFSQMACLLWAFDFCKVVDESGKEIRLPSMEFIDTGVTVHSAPFRCTFKARQPDLQSLLASRLEKETIA